MGSRFLALVLLTVLPLGLTGCLSHWFIETESRLQVENATEDITLYGVDVLAEDSVNYEKWIDETILPGERSHVAEADWVGEFRVRIRYGREGEDTLKSIRTLDIEGGSLFLRITAQDDTLVYTFK